MVREKEGVVRQKEDVGWGNQWGVVRQKGDVVWCGRVRESRLE